MRSTLPGDRKIEERLEALIRWNAMAMVHGQNKKDAGHRWPSFHLLFAGHLLEVGYEHFFPRYLRRPAGRFYLLSRPCFPESMRAPTWKAGLMTSG